MLNGYLIGRAYSWQEFAADGQDVWLLHLGDPAFFMRVVERPSDAIPSGEIQDMVFPLASDARYALGNLTFIEPRTEDPRLVARLVAGGIDAIHDPRVLKSLRLDRYPFDPPPVSIWLEDLPRGYIVGRRFLPSSDAAEEDEDLWDSDFLPPDLADETSSRGGGVLDPSLWMAHIGLPPFLMRVCDITREEVLDEDIWATVDGGYVLSDLHWLSSMACDREQLRMLAENGAEVIRDIARETASDY